jgi:hypothetical protein
MKKRLLLPFLSCIVASLLVGKNRVLAEPTENILSIEEGESEQASPLMMFRPEKPIDKNQHQKADPRRATENSESSYRSDERGIGIDGEEEEVNKYFENEICNNIYQSCLARVAEMNLGKIPLPMGSSLEASKKAEWEAANEMAEIEIADYNKKLGKAKQEIAAAQEKLDAVNLRLHLPDYAKEAYDNYQIKQLAEALADAQVERARATLHAIQFKDTDQREIAESKLEIALEKEREAIAVLAAAEENLIPIAKPTVSSSTKKDLPTQETEVHLKADQTLEPSHATIQQTFEPSHRADHKETLLDSVAEKKSSTLTLLQTIKQGIAEAVNSVLIGGKTRANRIARHLKDLDQADQKKSTLLVQAARDFEQSPWAKATRFLDQLSHTAATAANRPEKRNKITKAVENVTGVQSAKEAIMRTPEAWQEEQATDLTISQFLADRDTNKKVALAAMTKALQLESRARLEESARATSLARKEQDKVTAQAARDFEKSLWAVATRLLDQLSHDATKAVNENLTASRAAKQASQEGRGGENAYLWGRIVTKLEQAKESWQHAQARATQGELERATRWKQAAEASEAAAEGMKHIVLTYIAGEKEAAQKLEKENWSACYLSDAVTWDLKSEEALEKANRAERTTPKGRGESSFWKKRAEEYKKAAEYERKAAACLHADKKDEGDSWRGAGKSSHATAEYQIKAAEAEQNDKLMLVPEYRKLADLCGHALDYYLKGTAAYGAETTYEGTSWNNAGHGCYSSAEKLGKAIEAEAAGKPDVAQNWREAAKLFQDSIDPFLKAAAAHKAGKTDEGNSWNNAGDSLYYSAGKLGEAIEADAEGKPEVAQKWREAAKLNQDSIDPFLKAAAAHGAEKWNEGQSWDNAGDGFDSAAEKLEKAIEAESEGKPDIAQKWREAAKLNQDSVDPYSKAAAAHGAEKWNEGQSWDNAGDGFDSAAEKLGEAIEADAAGKPDVAQKWREAAKLFQDSIDPFIQAAVAHKAGKSEEGRSWDNAGAGFYEAVGKLGEATQAEAEGKLDVAQKWREAAKLNQDSIDPYLKAAAARGAGKSEEG